MNPIHTAALFGNLQCLKLLNPDKAYFFLPTSNTRQDLLIHLATYGGHTDVVSGLLNVECVSTVETGREVVHWILQLRGEIKS